MAVSNSPTLLEVYREIYGDMGQDVKNLKLGALVQASHLEDKEPPYNLNDFIGYVHTLKKPLNLDARYNTGESPEYGYIGYIHFSWVTQASVSGHNLLTIKKYRDEGLVDVIERELEIGQESLEIAMPRSTLCSRVPCEHVTWTLQTIGDNGAVSELAAGPSVLIPIAKPAGKPTELDCQYDELLEKLHFYWSSEEVERAYKLDLCIYSRRFNNYNCHDNADLPDDMTAPYSEDGAIKVSIPIEDNEYVLDFSKDTGDITPIGFRIRGMNNAGGGPWAYSRFGCIVPAVHELD